MADFTNAIERIIAGIEKYSRVMQHRLGARGHEPLEHAVHEQ